MRSPTGIFCTSHISLTRQGYLFAATFCEMQLLALLQLKDDVIRERESKILALLAQRESFNTQRLRSLSLCLMSCNLSAFTLLPGWCPRLLDAFCSIVATMSVAASSGGGGGGTAQNSELLAQCEVRACLGLLPIARC
jgi:hypothetical protein